MIRVANQAAGEVAIELDGAAWIMRPSWEWVEQVEARTGLTMLELAQRLKGGGVPLASLGFIVRAGIVAWARAHKDDLAAQVSEARIKELLLARGVIHAYAPVCELVAYAITGGERPGNGDAPTAEA